MLANIACVNSKCVKRQDRPGRSCKRTRDFTKVCCIFVNGSAIKVTDGKKKKKKKKEKEVAVPVPNIADYSIWYLQQLPLKKNKKKERRKEPADTNPATCPLSRHG